MSSDFATFHACHFLGVFLTPLLPTLVGQLMLYPRRVIELRFVGLVIIAHALGTTLGLVTLEMIAAEKETTALFATVRFTATDVPKTAVDLGVAARMIAVGRYTITNVTFPVGVVAN